MVFATLIQTMADAICRGDGVAAAECFHADGVYHDVFYGAFPRPRIGAMVSDYFHRDATNFIWDMHHPVADENKGYARYVFSYDSKLEAHSGQRAIFEGVSVCDLKDGLILNYHEVASTAPGLAALGFAPERVHKLAMRELGELAGRDEARHHAVKI